MKKVWIVFNGSQYSKHFETKEIAEQHAEQLIQKGSFEAMVFEAMTVIRRPISIEKVTL